MSIYEKLYGSEPYKPADSRALWRAAKRKIIIALSVGFGSLLLADIFTVWLLWR